MAICFNQTTIYAFANATTTTKTAYAVPVQGTCNATSRYLIDATEYNAYQAGVSTDTTQTTNIATQTTRIDTLIATLNDRTPNADVIEAEGIIFGVVFAAMCVIWGVRQVYKTFATSNVGHD